MVDQNAVAIHADAQSPTIVTSAQMLEGSIKEEPIQQDRLVLSLGLWADGDQLGLIP
jgi:hypothetical protein